MLDFLDRENPDELNAALAAVGSGYRIPAPEAQRQAPPVVQQEEPKPEAPAPEQPQAPAPNPVNKALEAVGSTVQVPEDQPAPWDPNVHDTDLAGSYQERTDTGNHLTNLMLAQGENKSAGEDKKTEVLAKHEQKQADLNAEGERITAKNRADKAQYEDNVNKRLEALQAKIDDPPSDMVSKITGVLASAVAVGGPNPISNVLGMISKVTEADTAAWARSIQGDKTLIDALKSQAEYENADTDSELRTQSQLSLANGALTQATLAKIASQTESKDIKNLAEQTAAKNKADIIKDQIKTQETERDYARKKAEEAAERQRKIDAARQAARFKAAKDQREAGIMSSLASIQDPKERIAAAAKIVGGMDALKKLQAGEEGEQKYRQGEASIDKTNADAAKQRGENAPSVMSLGGSQYELPTTIEKGTKAKLEQQSLAHASIQQDLTRLSQIRGANKGKFFSNKNDASEADFILAGLPDKLSNFFGGGAAGDAAAKRLMQSLSDPTDTVWRGEPAEAYKQIGKQLTSTLTSGIVNAGGRVVAGDTSQLGQPVATETGFSEKAELGRQADAAIQQHGMLDMINPDTGQTTKVHPSKRAMAEKKGFIVNAVAPEKEEEVLVSTADNPPPPKRWVTVR